MPTIRSGPLSAIDYAILLFALGLGGLAACWCVNEYWATDRPPIQTWAQPIFENFHRAGHQLVEAFTLGSILVLARDRGLWSRRGKSRLGVMTVAVATLLMCGGALNAWVRTRSMSPSVTMLALLDYFVPGALESSLSGSILGAWVIFALGGLWRPARDDRDRLGRLVGWCWLLLGSLRIIETLLFG